MARGLSQHQARKAAVAALGRSLSRRAKAKCELCGASGSLKVIEVPPIEQEPSSERAILACHSCQRLMNGQDAEDSGVRFLEETVWSEVVPAQLTAVRLVNRFAADGRGWAVAVMDGLYLSPEVERLV